jgi:type IV pilus assembly protein PilP
MPIQAPPQQMPPQVPDAGISNTGNSGDDDNSMVIQPSPEGYTYDPSGRRDPFKPYGQSQQSQVVIPQKTEEPEKPPMPTDPLQMYDVSQFHLVGIIWQVKNPKAVVRDPAGKMHLIYRETKIGRNSGFVASIREGEVLVVEPTVAENGMPSAITRSMTLKR